MSFFFTAQHRIRTKILFPFFLILVTMLFFSFGIVKWALSQQSTLALSSIFSVIGVSFLLFGGFFYFIYSFIIRNLTASIDILSTVAHQVSQGDLNQMVYLKQKDEIGDLALIFNQMVMNLKDSGTKIIREKNRSEAIVACLPEGIMVTDLDNKLILANARAEKMFHFTSTEVVGKRLVEYISDENLSNQLKDSLSENNQVVMREIVLNDDHDHEKIYELKSSLARSQHADPIGVITTLRDITHDKELEELREGFLRTVTHELRTPLTSIIGFIELLDFKQNPNFTEEQKKYLTIVHTESNHLKNLIEDLLELSRIHAGEVALLFIQLKVNDVVNNVCQSFLPLAQRKGLTLTYEKSDSDFSIEADQGSLRRILINLISNAIKFTDKGGIIVRVEDKGDGIRFLVEDTGIGLMDDEKEVIFQKFRQVDYSSTRQYEGIGLGLTIVKQLVEFHDGSVDVESTYGKGSTFSFTIPKVQVKSPVQIGIE